ncbi:S1 domain-containing post-transcriptional regulator GSP13 [Bacillus coahuilensis]|uniref:S1 domain-containing post-transcriptional regulator GSP13 n=1 Tax=Bacillus coahuilensis TaxID=408580 RepID=UPI000A3F6944|nr:S1 domain-containing post-transcriptional regulator GSP13 [Bacillus coahuilensis]
MSTKYEVGNVVTGKVTGIQPYGAFVALDEETQGLVHISEITHGFVKDVNEHLKIGDEVSVKVLAVEAEGKKSACQSVLRKKLQQQKRKKKKRNNVVVKDKAALKQQEEAPSGFNTLKDKLEEWIEQSKNNDLIKK